TQLLMEFAKERPVLLVVDDLQWADELSFAVLTRLGQLAGSAAVSILLTSRAQCGRAELASLIKKTQPVVVELERLDREAVAEITAEVAGVHRAPEALVQFVFDRSEGLPFFSTE